MADISVIKLPSGSEYNIKDAYARELIEELENYTDYLGVTTTELTDGATTNPITINGESVTAKKGNIVNYGASEFIFNGSAWQLFGDLSGLGSLAFKNSASGTYTPAGSVSATFTGTEATFDVDVTAAGDITIGTGAGTANYTPAGTISGTAVTASKTTITEVDSVGTLPTATMPTFTVTNEVLTFTDGSFSAGTLPTTKSTSVATDIDTVTDPTFSGTGVELTGSFTGSEVTAQVTYTPEGSISGSFTGTEATISVS